MLIDFEFTCVFVYFCLSQVTRVVFEQIVMSDQETDDVLSPSGSVEREEANDTFDQIPEAKRLSFDNFPKETEDKELVKVFLRIRPDHNQDAPNAVDYEDNSYDAIKALSDTTVQTIPPGKNTTVTIMSTLTISTRGISSIQEQGTRW